MKIGIVGAGAIGGWIGARLAARGHVVSALARGATLSALRQHGFRLHERGRLLQQSARASDEAARLGAQQLVIVALKGPALAQVVPHIGALLEPETIVITAMNGVPWWFFDGLPGPCHGLHLASLDSAGALHTALPSRQLIGCVVHATCTALAPGVVSHGQGNGLIVGEAVGEPGERLQAVAALLAEAGFEVTPSPRIQCDIWYKLWGNMTMNPISALTGATCDRILDDELVRAMCLAAMAEAGAIGARIGCPIAQSGEDRIAVTRKLGAFKTSMLQDAEAGKPLELEALLGAVREIGRHVAVPTPTVDALHGLTRLFARERGLSG